MDYFQRQQEWFYKQEEERRDEELNQIISETSMWTTVWTSFFSWWS